MNLLKELERLENSPVFIKWKEKNKDSYLCSFFNIIGNNEPWRIHFYSKEKDKITSFLMDEAISLEEDSQVFKDKNIKVKELKIKNVSIKNEDALRNVNKIINEKYPNETVNKTIMILQNIDKLMWNITCITNSLNMVNIKMDARSGNVIEEKLQSLMGMVDNE